MKLCGWILAVALLGNVGTAVGDEVKGYNPADMTADAAGTPVSKAGQASGGPLLGGSLPGGAVLAAAKMVGTDVAPDSLIEIDPNTAGTTFIGPVADPVVAGLAWDSTHKILYGSSTATSNLLRIDPDTGATAVIGPFGVTLMHAIEYDPRTDTLYGVTAFGTNSLYRINVTTGAATPIGPHGAGNAVGLAFDSTAGVMYLSSISNQSLYTVNLATGAATLVGPFNVPSGLQIGVALAFDPDLGLFAAENRASSAVDDNLYRVDKATGQATLVGLTNTGNLLGMAFLTGAASCNGGEVILKAKCKTKGAAVKKAIVQVTGTTPGVDYTCTLDTGESLTKTAGAKVKFTFKGGDAPPCGPNAANVCGLKKAFNCGC